MGSLVERLALVSAIAAAGSAAEAPTARVDPIAAAVFREVSAARESAGVSPLERRAGIDRVSRARASEIAGLPHAERLALARSIEHDLREAGLGRFRRTVLHVDLVRGYREPWRGFADAWREHETAWRTALTAELDAIGLGSAPAGDGWIVLVAVLVEDAPASAPGAREPEALERATLEAVNRARQTHGLAPLEPDAALFELARSHSLEMARTGSFSHRSPGRGDLAARAAAAGVVYVSLAENIHRNEGMADPVAVAIEAWLASPSHRRTLLGPLYRRTGIGVAIDDAGAVYFTQVFSQPRPEPAARETPAGAVPSAGPGGGRR